MSGSFDNIETPLLRALALAALAACDGAGSTPDFEGDGRVGVESEPGRGATFTITLPLALSGL